MQTQSMPPVASLLYMLAGTWITQSVYVAARLRIADRVKDGPASVEALAEATGAHGPSLYRILRALASLGVFEETEPGRFGLTPTAECLRSDVPGSLRAFALATGSDWNHRTWGDILTTVQTGNPATPRLHGVDSFFQFLASAPADAADFNEAMTGFAMQVHKAAVATYDFSGIRCLVDVGGGHGALLSTLLARYPEMRGILFDQRHVVGDAPKILEGAGVAARCEVMGGDFFDSVPAGGDAYILSAIIHDWNDERAAVLLKNIRGVVPAGGRLLLVESVIPPGNGPDFGKILDLQMLLTCGGKERTEAEFRALLAASGFRLTRIFPTASATSVIEALPA